MFNYLNMLKSLNHIIIESSSRIAKIFFDLFMVKQGKQRSKLCYSMDPGPNGWCGTCYEGDKKPGEEGYCDYYHG